MRSFEKRFAPRMFAAGRTAGNPVPTWNTQVETMAESYLKDPAKIVLGQTFPRLVCMIQFSRVDDSAHRVFGARQR